MKENVCHCEDDLNKISKIMKEREEKAFKYNSLVKRIAEKIKELVIEEETGYFDNKRLIRILQELLKEAKDGD